ncbi:MAG: hypothetical protein ACD_50C00034G0001 [uncultured bacterium]|uniref:Uncharacterized protein n=1 Tax=Candidatus Woesebacteria bacterium RIFCSPHIGHO2_12_FULL_41_24 TaxID=1802510 RepID=A0A1F8AU36_9BACT|nr:MAG: hypothetical protein ACD_50C00034G0001 [uncultured bacterium]OGM14191.1 MAG: hypothetical protein A2W15_03930 [Candidatus Woesebacteria bacterium RBG_16_41_13]OGM29145.1 MAG: hypothetical protein A2873_01390 [Candidatus Woesebacteria bacterium RIFCSPHIGHO2_01_FULL_42_80]OGM35652.1 MAG: hypothetical protein A3D84_03775 [Candidatus Woesebacteria bacterium RIFCSPHIGHO2_02_FULL_42_20]OGM55263.1 MAG: hypothetical protein A3E44_03185 [Candidatus Woesebacteria bacterium RIFCSPHIGHO2_12_FULL_41
MSTKLLLIGGFGALGSLFLYGTLAPQPEILTVAGIFGLVFLVGLLTDGSAIWRSWSGRLFLLIFALADLLLLATLYTARNLP